MEYIKNTPEAILEYVENMSDEELVSAHNIYCENSNSSDDEIFINDDDFFNTFFEGKTMEAVRAVCFGEFRYSDQYVVFNGYGNLDSFSNPSTHIDKSEICNDISENPDSYDIEFEEEEEEKG